MLELKSIHPNKNDQHHIVDDLYSTTTTYIWNMEIGKMGATRHQFGGENFEQLKE